MLLWGNWLTIFICWIILNPVPGLLETIWLRFILLRLRLIIRRDIITRGVVGFDLGQQYFLSDSFKSGKKGKRCLKFISWSVTLSSANYCAKSQNQRYFRKDIYWVSGVLVLLASSVIFSEPRLMNSHYVPILSSANKPENPLEWNMQVKLQDTEEKKMRHKHF